MKRSYLENIIEEKSNWWIF